ncbi:hypothetical protein [Reyranella sp.]|uniref:hypothetical protein n=1 Tax=Reyranella sp. TaxID=1929291 RepID=UPI0025E343CC|nr:hypothetical protein [Reyranella sp.]
MIERLTFIGLEQAFEPEKAFGGPLAAHEYFRLPPEGAGFSVEFDPDMAARYRVC